MKLTHCPRCGGVLRGESIGWKCEKCRGFIDMQGNFHEHTEKPFMPPMTNADRIRAMTDEELADLLMNEIWKCDKYAVCKECPRYIGECCLPIDEWLQQPAEGE